MQLPDAKPADNKSWNKLSFYEQADKDSARYKDAVKNDPFFQQRKDSSAGFAGRTASSLAYNPLPPGYEDANEYKVNQKLAQLNAVINKSNSDNSSLNNPNTGVQNTSAFQTKDVNRLEQMLQMINQPDTESDPETKQLNGMMDKILDIQHPERIADRIQLESEKNRKQVFQVVSGQKDNEPSLLEANVGVKTKGSSKVKLTQSAFYSLDSDTAAQQVSNGIGAQVQETQTVVSGSSVRLCLAADIYVNGILIPQGTFIYGTASQNAERLHITIASIRYQNSLLPVSLSVYDLDGLEGIYVPGSISRDVAKQSGSEALSNIGLSSLDPSLGAQAANVGIAAAKSLINKKVKQVKLTINAGYRVLLKDNNGQ